MLPPALPPIPGLPLRRGRVHEVEGPSAAAFAAIMAGMTRENLLWIRPGWRDELAFPDGLAALLPAERVLIARTSHETDTLAVAEEALKDGSVPFVLIETTKPLNLREGRRLQLAAMAGKATGLCLTPEGMGSNAAETRWHCAPVFAPDAQADSTLMRWEIKKNKSGTIGAWHVRWNAEAHRLDVVCPVRFGPGSADIPG